MLSYLLEYWPLALTSVAEGLISVNRIQEFLLLHKVSESEKITSISSKDSKNGIIFRNASAHWNQTGHSNAGLLSVDTNIGAESLTAIIGQVGCGKTTLLEVILKELPLSKGEMEVNGVISYSDQKAWIFEGSIKNNIIFTNEFNAERYKKVVYVCALERDFELLPHGDETIVGDRGVSLSGGQKARVSLARAIYKKADIYLLDDPLSAVDVHVGKHIFDKCIKDFLKVR